MLAASDRFTWNLGSFHALWSTAELLTCCAIGRLLKISDSETHILTAGMEFGRKATLLRNLVYHSEMSNKRAILNALNGLRDGSKRNILAHSFIVSDEDTVTFIDRARGGDYSATEHVFTQDEFELHVLAMVDHGADLQRELGISTDELQDFAHAALSVSSKSSKSPDPPSSKA